MEASWKHCLADFLRSLRSPATRTSYAAVLIRFFSEHEPEQVTRRDIEAFMRTPYPDPHRQEQKELTTATQNQRVAAIGSFYKFASRYVPQGEGEPLWNKANPTTGIARGKPERSPKGLSLEELGRLFSIIPHSTLIGIRDRAILLLYLWSARRRSEIADLCYRDIQSATFPDGRKGWIYFFRNKGSKSVRDSQELPQEAKEAIDWYLIASGRIETITPDDPLFVATSGVRGDEVKPLSAHTIAKRMVSYAQQAGLHASLHTLRHSSAKIRYESGEDIISLQNLLRHKDLRTLWLYITRLTGTEDKGAKLVEEKFGRFS